MRQDGFCFVCAVTLCVSTDDVVDFTCWESCMLYV